MSAAMCQAMSGFWILTVSMLRSFQCDGSWPRSTASSGPTPTCQAAFAVFEGSRILSKNGASTDTASSTYFGTS